MYTKRGWYAVFMGMHHILLSLHIILAIVWVGGVLFVGWGVYPAAKILPFEIQRQFFLSLIHWTHWLFTIAGSGVILTGILLGTALGPIRHWNDIWQTNFGSTWIAALIIALVVLCWGILIGYKYSLKVFSNIALWQDAETGNKRPLIRNLMKIAMIESVEVIGFIAIIFLMVLL